VLNLRNIIILHINVSYVHIEVLYEFYIGNGY